MRRLFMFLCGGGFAGIILFMISCAPFLDSPFSDQLLSTARGLNNSALSHIGDIENDGVIRLAVIADIHQNYKDFDKVIYQINRTPNIDFTVNLGDFTNSGYNLEYDQYLDSFLDLIAPALNVIGNHDSLGAGPNLFRKAFSDLDFWFENGNRRYIFFNSANLENPTDFNPEWLRQAVQTSTKPIIIFTHCDLRDVERFQGSQIYSTFTDVISNSRVDLIVNGHGHFYKRGAESGTSLLQVSRVENVTWTLLEIQGSQLTITQKNSGQTEVVTLKN